MDGDALDDAADLTGGERIVRCLAVLQRGEQRDVLREHQIGQRDERVVQTGEAGQYDGRPELGRNRLGAEHGDGVLAELGADLGDDVEVVEAGVRIGRDVDHDERVGVEHRLRSVAEAQRGVEVRHHLARGQLQQLERGLPGEALQRSAAEVDEPLLLGLGERADVGLLIHHVLGGRGEGLGVAGVRLGPASAGTTTTSRSGSTSSRSRRRWCAPACRRPASWPGRRGRVPTRRRGRR